MKISKFYSNKPNLFEPIVFSGGVNAIYGEIRVPENREKDTHNLGKSTLGRLLDFALLSKRSKGFFIFKHFSTFEGFVFFLELEIGDSKYLTIKRDVAKSSKISFKSHSTKNQDYRSLPDDSWDHSEVPFDRAKSLLDSILNLGAIKPWHFRNALGYFLRSQEDYLDVFQLRKFRSKDAEWKPYLAHLLGFDAKAIIAHYECEKELEEKTRIETTVKNELGGSIEDVSKIEGLLLLKKSDLDKKLKKLDEFDFRMQDKEKTELLVDVIDEKISRLNNRRYYLNHNRRKIIKSMEEEGVVFSTNEAKKLFEEAGLLFPGQVKKDFDQLIEFNKAITEERYGYLKDEKNEVEEELRSINKELKQLGIDRSKSLSFLSDTEVFSKYKLVSNELSSLKADLEILERQKQYLQKLQILRSEIRVLKDDLNRLQAEIEKDVETQNSNQESFFSKVRIYFSDIVDQVISRKALLSISPNKLGHLQFKAEILDEQGNATSADAGHTYKKLLCIAFDLAVQRAHLDNGFLNFAFHDGIFESLDDRKKENLYAVIREYSSMGIQSIVTYIDSDLPVNDESEIYNEDEIVLRLHDEGEQGRLFKMKSW